MNFIRRIKNHTLLGTFRVLNPNTKVIVATEPMWGIPFHLLAPFVALYQAALGLNDRQIGMVASIAMFMFVITGLPSGAITDKLGRRLTTLLGDILSWSVPCLIWVFSQNVWWFYAAAVFHGFGQLSGTSWNCLVVENVEQKQIVNVWQLIYLSSQLVVLFAPLSGLLVRGLGVVNAMRILYGFAFIAMTAKFIVMYAYAGETEQGKRRMEETKNIPMRSLLAGYGGVLRNILKSRDLVRVLGLSVLLTISSTAISMFFGLYTTQNIGLPQESLAYLPILRAVIMLMFFFFLTPRLDKLPLRAAMMLGIGLYICSQILLILSGGAAGTVGMYPRIIIYIMLEAFAFAMVSPRRDSLMAIFINPRERARMLCIMNATVTLASMPFGYITGWLSGMDRRLPFGMAIVMFALALSLTIFIRVNERDGERVLGDA